MPELSNKGHEKFARNIVKGLSQTEAYKKAGYSAKTADNNAHRLMENEGVKARISELNAKLVKESLAQADEVRHFWTKVMRGEVVETRIFGKDAERFDDLPPQISDRLRAADSLAKALGIFGGQESTDDGQLAEYAQAMRDAYERNRSSES